MTYAVQCRKGQENAVARKLNRAARVIREIVAASITPWPGYVRVEIVSSGDSLDLPKELKEKLKVLGIKVVGNGNEAVPVA